MSEKPNITLPKWPFLIGDIILILLACFIVISSPKPMSGIGIFACTLSVILGMLVFVTPYIIEHLTLQQKIKLKQAKAEETLLKAVELASDLLSRTESIHAEIMKGVLSVRQVPAKLEEKTEELVEIMDSDKLANSLTELSDLLNRLETQAIPQASDSKNALSKEAIKELLQSIPSSSAEEVSTLSDTLGTHIEELRNEILERFSELEGKLEAPTHPSEAPSSVAQATEIETEAGWVDPPDSDETETREEIAETEEDDDDFEVSIEEELEELQEPNPIEKDELSDDAEQEEASDDMEQEEAPDAIEPEEATLETEVLIDEGTQDQPEDELAIKQNEDGATRLIVGAFIGISNKLFIRGEGPGLDWDKGTPMELVGIGKWEWKTYDASSAIKCKVLINDEQWTDSENITIEPNTTVETTASF